ncbi:uncharacterized protein LOC122266941 [Penaeus japonicus]|uniref:uncharacterized protein LOC122266941 n=1 Tax=Penaeus japonicus TaxID=27405 RepID=UPI001C7151E4|nr:uncharacterized protein LOC122266941 [Penaeus japonicus]
MALAAGVRFPAAAMLVLASAPLATAGEVVIAGALWQSTHVPAALAPEEVIGVDRELLCASYASQRSWCQVYCFVDGVCSMYDEVIPAKVTTSFCKTISPPCPSPFSPLPDVEDLGCIYELLAERPWQECRDTCQGYGGDLAAPNDPQQYLRMINYFKGYISGGSWWVGMYDNVWVSGRPGVAAEWNGGQPTGGATLCGVMIASSIMAEYSCSMTKRAICQAWP